MGKETAKRLLQEGLVVYAAARRVEHLQRQVDAEQRRGGVTMRHRDQVARGAAADLQHAPPGGRREALDQPVSAQQVVFAAEIVDVALAAIDPVHETGIGEGRAHGFST